MGNTVGLPACPKGNSMTFNVIVNQNGSPIDITGYAFSFIANKDLSGKLQPPVNISWIQTALSPNGETTFEVPGSLTGTLEPGSYYFNLDMADPVGNITTIMAGTWPITAVPGMMSTGNGNVPPVGGGGTPPPSGGVVGDVMLKTDYAIGAGSTNPDLVDHAMFADAGGEMRLSVYDKNNNGIVDTADSIPWASVSGTIGIVELQTSKNYPNGYAGLDQNGLLPINELPPTVVLEAPQDGTIYGRENATWSRSVPEAPTDGQFYGRQSSAWIALPPTGVLNYSTNEQWTGRLWLDGSKVYQKTINLGALPGSNNTGTVAHNITFLANIIHHDGWAHDSTKNGWLPLPAAGQAGSYLIFVDTVNITISAQSVGDVFNSGYLTLYYTCTNR
jgi:hypothetical protein